MMNVAQSFHGAKVVVTLLIMKQIGLLNRFLAYRLKA